MLKLFRFSFVFLNSLYVINGLNSVLSQNKDDINNCDSKSVNLSNDNTNCKYFNESYHNTTNRQEENILFSLQNAIKQKGMFEKMYFLNYPMDFSNSSNKLCRTHSQIYLNELEKLTPWALKMYDSSAKMPSSILNGNINQLGDFDQCLDVNVKDENIKGQYCLTNVELTLSSNTDKKLKYILDHLLSYSILRSTIDDPIGTIFARFTIINWGVCTPASCLPVDIERELNSLFSKHVNIQDVNFRLKVDPKMCQTIRSSYIPTKGLLVAVLIFTILFAVIILSTLMDSYKLFENLESTFTSKILISFSLKRNVRNLINVSESSNDIKSVNAVRVLNAVYIMLLHMTMMMLFNAYSNRNLFVEFISKPWAVFVRSGAIFTDLFLFLSALLSTTILLKKLDKTGKIDWFNLLLKRYIRLVPSMGAIILFITLILPNLGSGPQWPNLVDQQSDTCRKYWWRNMFFIQNYYTHNNMCLLHTHHIATDWQLFMISPLLVWTLWKWQNKGMVLLIGLASVSTGLRYYVASTKKLNLFMHNGISNSEITASVNYSYFLPVHRLTVYVMGIIMGYCLYYIRKDYKLTKSHLILGWIIAFGLIYKTFFKYTNMTKIGYVYNESEAADFIAFSPIYFCLVLSWIIFISNTSEGGFFSSLLSWKGFVICSRISYSIYLSQFLVFFYFIGSNRFPSEFNYGLFVNLNYIFIILLTSIILTVTVEMPFNNMRSLFTKKISNT